ncbi:MAG: hypothetical protein HY659_10735 [Rhizobiales bacterium]|nr:hypothetical protein [Hyphomicrobiales bacterium]
MKKFLLPAVVAVSAITTPAAAADLGKMVTKGPPAPAAVSPYDLAWGVAIMNDYVFRGITQSNHKGSVAGYFEPRYNASKDLQFYVGIAGESISFPNNAAAEIDFYGGVRPTFGKLALDFGAWYYYYPGGKCYNGLAFGADCLFNSGGVLGVIPSTFNGFGGNVIKKDLSFYEVYAKATYAFSDMWVFGANFYYSPSFLNSGADGEYLSGTIKWIAPSNALPNGVGFYVSGEFGRQWLGTSDSFYGIVAGLPIASGGTTSGVFANGIPYADYNTWNIGIGWTWKVFTLDLRYSDTDLSKGDCNAFTSSQTASGTTNVTSINPTGLGTNWCGSAFIAKFSADMTLDSLK